MPRVVQERARRCPIGVLERARRCPRGVLDRAWRSPGGPERAWRSPGGGPERARAPRGGSQLVTEAHTPPSTPPVGYHACHQTLLLDDRGLPCPTCSSTLGTRYYLPWVPLPPVHRPALPCPGYTSRLPVVLSPSRPPATVPRQPPPANPGSYRSDG